MDKQQRKYLNERFHKSFVAKRSKAYDAGGNLKEPAEVRAARRVVRRFEKQKRRLKDRAVRRVEKAASNVKEHLLFGDEKTALLAVKRFEKFKP